MSSTSNTMVLRASFADLKAELLKAMIARGEVDELKWLSIERRLDMVLDELMRSLRP